MYLCGWIDRPKDVDKVITSLQNPFFKTAGIILKDSGKGKKQLLYKYLEKLIGRFNLRTQGIGDCVAQATAVGIDHVKACEIILRGQAEEWVAETATEPIYAGSRVTIGKGQLGNQDGSIGGWAAEYVKNYGTLVRQKYESIDLTVYSGARARDWGQPRKGVPALLLPYEREHPIRSISLITTYEQARDAVYNGYAIGVASNQGFSDKRDSEGFARPEGSWPHEMCVIAVDDEYRRPGVLIANTWGIWNSGPKRHEQPDGTFWVDAEVFERNMLSARDSWALSDYEGFPVKELSLRLF